MVYLVSGGAGYLGSHIVDELVQKNFPVIVVDDLSTGKISRIHSTAIFVNADIRDENALENIFSTNKITGVFHCAAKKSVIESLQYPELYNDINLEGTRNLLQLCGRYKVRNFVFTSSAAVYGGLDSANGILETSYPTPINPYGSSKVSAEFLVEKFVAEGNGSGMSLRVFNISGASRDELFDHDGDNVISVLKRASEKGESFLLFGTNFPTKDKTGVRDYVHVLDVARAHLLAMDFLENEKLGSYFCLNISSGFGTSVKDLIFAVEEIAKTRLVVVEVAAREGESGSIIGSNKLASATIHWAPKYALREIVRSALGTFNNF
jgi:UDP-glucose 4-epimerase